VRCETWVWDNTWQRVSTDTGPSDTAVEGLAFDGATNQLVLLSYDGTWLWTGGNWQLVGPSFLLPGEISSAGRQAILNLWDVPVVYDASTRQLLATVVLIGSKPHSYDTQTWQWTGSTWNEVVTTGSTEPGVGSMAYDRRTRQLVFFGGIDVDGAIAGRGTLVWNGTGWQTVSPNFEPTPFVNGYTQMVYDPGTKSLLLEAGGVTGNPYRNGTWEWSGGDWRAIQPAESIVPGVSGYALGYDPPQHEVLLFGGYSPITGGYYADLWKWKEQDWTRT